METAALPLVCVRQVHGAHGALSCKKLPPSLAFP